MSICYVLKDEWDKVLDTDYEIGDRYSDDGLTWDFLLLFLKKSESPKFVDVFAVKTTTSTITLDEDYYRYNTLVVKFTKTRKRIDGFDFFNLQSIHKDVLTDATTVILLKSMDEWDRSIFNQRKKELLLELEKLGLPTMEVDETINYLDKQFEYR